MNEVILFILIMLSLCMNVFLFWAVSNLQESTLTVQSKVLEILNYLNKKNG